MSVDLNKLVQSAIAGDRTAMGRLLLLHDERLRRRIGRWIGPEFKSVLSVEDVLQEAYATAYQHIRSYEPREGSTFYAWLAILAERTFLNIRRGLLAAKRDQRKRVHAPADGPASFVPLIEVLGAGESTPSSKAARREAQRCLLVAMGGLKDDYRDALRMRYLEGRPVREIAAHLNRTEHAVHMLCNRGLRALRERMGEASRFLSAH